MVEVSLHVERLVADSFAQVISSQILELLTLVNGAHVNKVKDFLAEAFSIVVMLSTPLMAILEVIVGLCLCRVE